MSLTVSCRRSLFVVSGLRLLTGAALLAAAGLTVGCSSTGSQSTEPMPRRTATSSPSAQSQAHASSSSGSTTPVSMSMSQQLAADLDARFTVGPTAAERMSYRVDWNVNAVAADGHTVKMASIGGDSLFAIDNRNNLTRIRRETGDRLWNTPVAEQFDAVHGITRVTDGGRDVVLITTDSDIWSYDVQNGTFVSRHRLRQVGSTAPVVIGSMLIYGSINGQLVWFQHEIGTGWRAYDLGGGIRLSPVRHRDVIVAVTSEGKTMALNANQATQYWSKTARAGVVARPAVNDLAVYVASLDQHLYAYDLNNGRVRWFRLTSAPLRTSPTVLNDQLYQYVPGEGLHAFDPMPPDTYYDGRVLWTAPEVSGEVIGAHRGRVFAWDRDARVLSIVSERTGDLYERISLPRVRHLHTSSSASGDFYAVSDEGVVTRLVPRP